MSYLRSDFDWNAPLLPRPLHQMAILLVDYLVATGVLKDAEALRREGEARERRRKDLERRYPKKRPAKKTTRKKKVASKRAKGSKKK